MARILKMLGVTLWCLYWQLVGGPVCQAGWVKDYVTPVTKTWSSVQDINAAGEVFASRVTSIDIWNRKTLGDTPPGEMSKIDPKGKVLWSNRYYITSPNGDLPMLIDRIRCTEDGGCIVSGNTRENLTDPWARPYWFVMKLDADGAVSWMTRFGHQLALRQTSFPWVSLYDVEPASDGGYVVAGTYRYDLGKSWGFVIKLGTNGELEWQRRIEKYSLNSNSGRNISAYRVASAGDGDFFVVGWSDEGSYYGRLMIFKVDQSGNLLWQKKVSGGTSGLLQVSIYSPNVLASTGDGGLVVATQGGVVMKFDNYGNSLWGKMIGGYPSLFHSENGGFYYVKSANPLKIIELDENAGIVWERDFTRRLGQYPMLAAVDGGINLVYSDSSNVGSGYNNFGVARVDSSGRITDCDPSVLVTPAPPTDINLTVEVIQGLESTEQFFQVPAETVIKQAAVISAVDDKCNPVNDAPVADAGDPQVVRCVGPSGALVQLDGSWSSDPDGDQLSYSWSGPFGQETGVNPLVQLPFGDHPITLTVTDSFGNSSQASVLISVVDDIAPRTSLSISGMEGSNGWYTSGLNLSFYSTDNCAGCTEIQYALDGIEAVVPGNMAGLQINEEGYHSLSYRAVDRAGNQEPTSHLALAIDQTPPRLSLPADIVVEAVAVNGAAVDFLVGATDNLDPNPVISCAPVLGTTFAIGTSSVTCTSSDLAGNTAAGSFQVTVADTVAPVVVPPSNQEVQYRGRATTVDIGQATAVDAVGVSSLVNDAPEIFPLGITLVTWTATDLYGNIGTTVQTIRVVRGNSEEVRNDSKNIP